MLEWLEVRDSLTSLKYHPVIKVELLPLSPAGLRIRNETLHRIILHNAGARLLPLVRCEREQYKEIIIHTEGSVSGDTSTTLLAYRNS